MERSERKILKTTVMLLVPTGATAAVLYLLLRNINVQALIGSLHQAGPRCLAEIFGISLIWNIGLYAFIRKAVWRSMGYALSLRECLFIRAGSLPFQAIPSFKDTGLAKALYLKKLYRMPLSEGVLSNIVVNFFSLLGLLFLILTGYIFHGPPTPGIVALPQNLAVKLAPVMVVVLFVLYAFYLNQELGKRLLFYICFKKRTRLYRVFERNIDLWKKFSGRKIFGFFILSAVFKMAEVIMFFLLAQAFQLKIPVTAIFLYVPLAVIISESPVNLSGIGVREGALVLFFYHFAAKETLVAAAVLIFIANRVAPLIVGLFFLLPFLSRMQLSFAGIREQLRSESMNLA